MSTLTPPVSLENAASNQFRVDYIQDVASQPDFDYPHVSFLFPLLLFLTLSLSLSRLLRIKKDSLNLVHDGDCTPRNEKERDKRKK